MSSQISTAFGLLMVAAAAIQATGPAIVAIAFAVVAVLAGTVFRPAATAAVLLAAAAITWADASPLLAAVAGLCAVAYLVLRHTAATAPTVIGALGFTVVGLVATAFPIHLPWLPLLAPLAVLAIYVLTTHPFVGAEQREERPSL